MIQFALDKDTHDLVMEPGGQLRMLDDEATVVGQRLRTLLSTFQGECLLAPSAGVPYIKEIFKKNPDLNRIRAIFIDVIARDPGVYKVQQLELTLTAERNLLVVLRVKLRSGNTLEVTL